MGRPRDALSSKTPVKRKRGAARAAPGPGRERGWWRRIWQYLFEDFAYVADFGPSLDYETYWEEQDRVAVHPGWQAVLDSKWQLMAGFIEKGSTVLDIGCGDGSLLAYLREHRSVKPFGVELSHKACELARGKGIEVVQADLTRGQVALPQVDYIVMSQFLEHIPNPESVLLQVKDRFTKRLFVDVPNTGALNDRLRLLFGRSPKQWVFHPAEHLRFWTVKDFLSMCRQLGYRTEYFGLYAPPYQIAGLKPWRWYPRLFARYVLYVLQREPELDKVQ